MTFDLGTLGKLLFWTISIGMFLYEIYQMAMANSTKNWKSHSAKVIDVKIDIRVDEGTEESKPIIKYQYHYKGSFYKGSKVKYGILWFTHLGKAHAMVSGLKKGSEITVFVNPHRPNQSVLYQGYEGNALLLLAFFSVFFFIAAIV
ncbi:MAG: DUF3592 domain-containing protein [Marinicellaceae bacterium]